MAWKYWSYLAAKLVGAAVVLYGVLRALVAILPRPEPFAISGLRERYTVPNEPFAHDLGYTFVMLLFTLLCSGVMWAVIWDQRYRCRTCLRRLRMPILRGSWTRILLGRPQTEYICPFGHGTLMVEELQLTGHQAPDWQPHEDIWKELYSLETTKE